MTGGANTSSINRCPRGLRKLRETRKSTSAGSTAFGRFPFFQAEAVKWTVSGHPRQKDAPRRSDLDEPDMAYRRARSRNHMETVTGSNGRTAEIAILRPLRHHFLDRSEYIAVGSGGKGFIGYHVDIGQS
jgi:hypothetical protein